MPGGNRHPENVNQDKKMILKKGSVFAIIRKHSGGKAVGPAASFLQSAEDSITHNYRGSAPSLVAKSGIDDVVEDRSERIAHTKGPIRIVLG
jgi:hypothetical protein